MENGNDSQSAIPRREVLCELMGEVEELGNTNNINPLSMANNLKIFRKYWNNYHSNS